MIQSKKFQKKIEDFECEKCGAKVKGGGFTDHCPKCLRSKHVDINPGDRAADCGGQMKPVGIDFKGGEYTIYYQCQKCGYEHKVKATEDDSMDEIIRLSKIDR